MLSISANLRSRQWICRILFLDLAVVPTLVISLWAAVAHTQRAQTQQKTFWEARVLQELGLAGRAQHMRKGERGDWIFDALQLIDPETDSPVASARRVHVAPAGERGWVIDAAYPQISSEQLPRLWNPIYDRLRHTRGDLDWTGLVTARNVTLIHQQHQQQQQDASQTLSVLECQFGSSRSGSFAKIDFLVAGLQMDRRAEIIISRDRTTERPPETLVLLKTGGVPLPCSLAYAAVPALSHLGDECRFQGELKLRLLDHDWRGEEMNGQLGPVDLANLVGDLFPHHVLTGEADITILQAQFENGRLVSAEGEVHADNGSISRTLLAGAAEQLGWHVADLVQDSTNSRFRFVAMHFRFRMDGKGLLVVGRCGEPGVILLGEEGPLAWESGQSVPITNCVRLLVPDSTYQVPATRQTAWLNGVLPVPSIAPARTAIRPANPALRLQQLR